MISVKRTDIPHFSSLHTHYKLVQLEQSSRGTQHTVKVVYAVSVRPLTFHNCHLYCCSARPPSNTTYIATSDLISYQLQWLFY